MTRVAFVLAAWSAGSGLRAQEPTPLPADMQGVWREPGKPGEDPSLRWKLTVAGEKVTVHVYGQEATGVARVRATERGDRLAVVVVVTEVKGAGPLTKGTFYGECRVAGDQMALRFDAPPRPVLVDDGRNVTIVPPDRDLAPVAIAFERAKK
jgi:hypothetical protein